MTRILSQTNYYPNLIQLYCTHLLRHVTSPNVTTFDPKTSPPYIITSQHVDEAYHSQELWTQIGDRFKLTLQLDQRYEVIAYAIAYRYLMYSEDSLVDDGFSVSQVRQDVLGWWSAGFQHTSEDAIRVLLDEMVGLGVLRIVAAGKYTLRSQNLVLLMGTPEEIERVLESNREAPIEYEPSSFRSALPAREGSDQFHRSPLTAQQESELRSHQNGVSIIFGCPAAGLNDLKDLLELASGEEFFFTCDSLLDKADFAKRLSEELNKRQKNGVTLALVLPTCPWSESWVEEAVEKIRLLKSKNRFVRIVFVADPQITWELLLFNGSSLNALTAKGVTTFSLQRWHDAALRQWLEDCGFSSPNNSSGRERITRVTGNWSLLLRDFYQRSKSDPHRWEQFLQELEKDLSRQEFAQDITCALGLDRHRHIPRKVLHHLAVLGNVSLDDLLDIIKDIPPEDVKQSLIWADLLNLTTPAENGLWCVDDLIARILPVMEK